MVRQIQFDKCIELNTKARQKDHVGTMAERLISYYSDQLRKERKTKLQCRYCYYIDVARIGGAAMTTVGCAICGEEMTFGSTCTDVLCKRCAEKEKRCCHCGCKLD